MTDQHPLTDRICFNILSNKYDVSGSDWHKYQNTVDLMRAAADWQLEKIMAWGYKHLYPDQILALADEMRPTADNAPWLDTTYDGFKHSIRHSETANE